MEKKITEELLHEIADIQDVEDFLSDNSTELMSGTLHEYMDKLLEKQSLKKTEVIAGSNLNRAYVYQIFLGDKLPSRDKVIALAFGFKLNLNEMQRFLKQSGHRELYVRDKRDAVIIFAVNKGMNLFQTNELLFDLSEPVIE